MEVFEIEDPVETGGRVGVSRIMMGSGLREIPVIDDGHSLGNIYELFRIVFHIDKILAILFRDNAVFHAEKFLACRG